MGDILQPTHLLFVLVIALIVLGPKRLPEVGRSLGKGLRDFRGAMSGIQDEITGATDPNAPNQAAQSAPAPMVASAPMTEGAPATATAATAVVDRPVLNAAPAEALAPVTSAAPAETVEEASERVFGVPAVPQPTPAATVVHEPLPSEYAD